MPVNTTPHIDQIVEIDDPLPRDIVIECLSQARGTSLRAWLVGGAARSMFTGERIADYDIVFGSVLDLSAVSQMLMHAGAYKLSETIKWDSDEKIGEDYRLGDAFIQLKYPRFYDAPEHQLDTADFTICQFYVSLGEVREGEFPFACTKQALIDTKAKVLRLHKLSQPAATIGRVNKFVVRGYKPWNNAAFYTSLVNDIRTLPYSVEGFEPIRKRHVK